MKTLTVTALLCAIMAVTRAAETHPLVKRSASCPKYWTEIGGHCFRFIQRAMTWAKAEKNCLSLGGHLASVHSVLEYHDIQKLIMSSTFSKPLTWIGGSDAQGDSEWFWSDGTHFDYTMWGRRLPDNIGGHQHCIQMNWGVSKAWDDRQCHIRLPSVCAKST
ncbi:ladderlectin-like isoform 2-T2 [Spinachia spinachia]